MKGAPSEGYQQVDRDIKRNSRIAAVGSNRGNYAVIVKLRDSLGDRAEIQRRHFIIAFSF